MNSKHDAVDLLKGEHQEAVVLFGLYRALSDDQASARERQAIALEICQLLSAHCQIEEELFYPAVGKAIGNDPLMDEAEVEHAVAKALIAQIMAMKPADALYDAKVNVLARGFRHQVKDAHARLFPLARKAGVDLLALGARMQRRKDQLLAQRAAQAGVEDENADPVGAVSGTSPRRAAARAVAPSSRPA